jgi:hypothetical protein
MCEAAKIDRAGDERRGGALGTVLQGSLPESIVATSVPERIASS